MDEENILWGYSLICTVRITGCECSKQDAKNCYKNVNVTKKFLISRESSLLQAILRGYIFIHQILIFHLSVPLSLLVSKDKYTRLVSGGASCHKLM